MAAYHYHLRCSTMQQAKYLALLASQERVLRRTPNIPNLRLMKLFNYLLQLSGNRLKC